MRINERAAYINTVFKNRWLIWIQYPNQTQNQNTKDNNGDQKEKRKKRGEMKTREKW